MRSRKRAEFERISWPRRLSSAGDAGIAHRRALGGEPARADVGIGEKGRGHDRLDHRRRHRVVEDGRIEQRIGAIARRHTAAACRSSCRGPGRRIPAACTAKARRPALRCVRSRRRSPRPPPCGPSPARACDGRAAVRRPRCACMPERAADVLAAGVAGGRFLRERLHRRIDGEVDREADVDRRAVRSRSDSARSDSRSAYRRAIAVASVYSR